LKYADLGDLQWYISCTGTEFYRVNTFHVHVWRKLHNEELHGLYSSPSIVRVIKARMRWAGHVARMGEVRGATFWLGGLKGGDN
jgi:hypothetical protein